MQARLRWFRVLLVAVLFVLGGGTTTASAATFTYDVFTVARFEMHQIEDGEAAPALPGDARDESAVLSAEARGSSTTLHRSVVATEAATSRTPLTDMASEIRQAGLHPAARNQRTIAVGADESGRLFAGSSNGFDAGQRAAMERLGVSRVPGSASLHAEEELLRGVPTLSRVGTSVRTPCGPAEHNCLAQLVARGVGIE